MYNQLIMLIKHLIMLMFPGKYLMYSYAVPVVHLINFLAFPIVLVTNVLLYVVFQLLCIQNLQLLQQRKRKKIYNKEI